MNICSYFILLSHSNRHSKQLIASSVIIMQFIAGLASCFLAMTREIRSTRPARAAIAAVLAFSATPLLAQEVAPSPVAPVAEPAAPQVAPAMEAAPPAPTPAPVASAPVMAPAQPVVQSTPSVEDRKAEAIAQAESARAEATSAPVQRVKPRPAVRTAAPTPIPAETVAAVPVRAVAPAPVEAAPVAPDMASAPAEPVAVTPPVSNDLAQADNNNDALTWGLAGSALLLVGAAGAMAMRRRRNRAGNTAYRVDEGVTVHRSERIVAVPESTLARELVEPTFMPMAPVAKATRTPLAADTPHGSLAAMVDAPPSSANPFLTRSNRMRRAHFLLAQQADGAERSVATAATVAPQVAPVDRSQAVYRFGKDDARRSGLIPRTR